MTATIPPEGNPATVAFLPTKIDGNDALDYLYYLGKHNVMRTGGCVRETGNYLGGRAVGLATDTGEGSLREIARN